MTKLRKGRCTNFGNCTKADGREDIDIADPYNAPCPECGMPLVPYEQKRRGYLPILLGTAAIFALGWGALYSMQEKIPPPKPIPDPTPKICAPLLMEGKNTLYQRILTKPKARKTSEPGSSEEIQVTPFSRYYVYARRTIGNDDWLNIGSGTRCQKDGWIKAADTIPWNQQLTLALTNPAVKGRGKAYFFNTKEAAENGSETGASPDIMATEPDQYVDWKKTFYLLPILGFESRNNSTLLKIAGATLTGDDKSMPTKKSQDLAVVFVVDTTVSMKPYIDKVKEAVRGVYDRFHQSPYRDHVKFGFLGFRSNIKATPRLEYQTKIFVDPNNPEEENNFVNIIVKDVREADVSSIKFDEDSYAGMLAAIHQINWDNFLDRNIILVTDAGAIEPHEKLSDGSQISAVGDFTGETIRNVAKSKGINLYALHLKTETGKNDHEKAERQYRGLTVNPITKDSLYYSHNTAAPGKSSTPLQNNNDESAYFGDSLTCIVQRISATMLDLLANGKTRDQQLNTEYCPKTALEDANPDFGKQKAKLREDQLLLGNALRLKYRGATQNANIPDVMEAWITGKTVEANILLSRAELSDLAEKLKSILDSDAEAKASSGSQTQQFFRALKKKASILLNDPKRLPDDDSTLGELFNLEELEHLPYKSRIMQVTEAEWEGFNLNEREDILRDLRAQLTFYQEREASPSDWKKLADEPDAEEVTLIPITLLP